MHIGGGVEPGGDSLYEIGHFRTFQSNSDLGVHDLDHGSDYGMQLHHSST